MTLPVQQIRLLTEDSYGDRLIDTEVKCWKVHLEQAPQ